MNRLSPGLVLTVCTFAVWAQPEPVMVEKTERIAATVESIDQAKRLLELSRDDERMTVHAPPEVRNFERIKVGDQVVVEYYGGLAAAFRKPGDESADPGVVDVARSTSRMPEGSRRPGAAVAEQVTTTVVIDAVGRSSSSVTFTGPAGMTRTVDVKDPRAQQFISTLKKGDEVELTYVEALAVTVEPHKDAQ